MSLILKGRVVNGDKSGAYFISQYVGKIRSKLGYAPFPGTLNIECNTTPRFPTRSHFISSWAEHGKQFGAVWIYPATMLNTRVHVVVPEMTSHASNIVEVISPHCLKSKLKLKNGDFVEIEIEAAK